MHLSLRSGADPTAHVVRATSGNLQFDMSVDVKEAVAQARHYLVELFPVTGRVELEEVEPHPSHSGWRITFSYDREEPDPIGLHSFLPPQQRPTKRVYKVVTVRSDGIPESITIRQ